MMEERDSGFDREPHFVTVTCTFTVQERHADRLKDLYEGVTLAFTPQELIATSIDVGAPWSKDVAEQLSLFEQVSQP